MGNEQSTNQSKKAQHEHEPQSHEQRTSAVVSTTGGSRKTQNAATATAKQTPNKRDDGSTEQPKKEKQKKQQQFVHRLCVTDHSVFDDYEIVKPLGEGSTCKVYAVLPKKGGIVDNKDNNEKTTTTTHASSRSRSSYYNNYYALKEISKDRVVSPYVLQEVKNEIEILSHMDHPNILRVYDMYESKRHLYIVMEYCAGGDLTSRYPYSEAQVAKIMTKLLSAIAYLHQHKVVHRDIKLENIMFEKPSPSNNNNDKHHDDNDNDDLSEIKLIDFGLSKQYFNKKHSKMKQLVGSAYTMAPEVLKGEYTEKADLWSAGVVCYCLLSATWPFDGPTTKDVLYKIHTHDYDEHFEGDAWKLVSVYAKSFVSSLLNYDPDKRVSAAQALLHKWLHREFSLVERQPPKAIMNDVRNAVVQSTQDGKFKKVAMMVIAHHSSVDEIASLRRAFDQYDISNCGTITYWEFRRILQKEGNYSDQELKQMFKSLDINETGCINYSEFLAATLESRGKIVEERITQAFDSLDSDNSGFISRQNLCEAVRLHCSERVTTEIMDELMDEGDINKDGKISYEEFLQVFRAKKDVE